MLLMRMALALLDRAGDRTFAGCRLQHAIDTLAAGSTPPELQEGREIQAGGLASQSEP